MLNFIKNRFKFASGRPTVLDSDLSEQELEKWEIEIRRGCDVEDLADITEKCCHRFFPQARWCGLFIDEDQNGNLKNPTTSAYLPTNGSARSAGSYRAFKNSGIINEGDELFSLISPLLPHTLTKSDVANAIQGNWLPVRHETGPSLGLLLIAGEAIVENKHNMEVLRFIQNSVLSSLSHMFYNKMSHNSRILSKLYSCEDSLSADQSCILSQVMESCRATHGFFLTYYEDDEGFTLYVADSYECKPAPSFSKEVLPHVYDYMKTKESHLLSMDTPHIRDEILHVMSHARGNSMTNGELSNKKTRHVMLNPVLRKETLLGVCVLLGNSTVFSLEEMKIARDVLNSASTILHKDIIIEHERNLRQQNEKLHQVAKNLFTHLGHQQQHYIKHAYGEMLSHADLCTKLIEEFGVSEIKSNCLLRTLDRCIVLISAVHHKHGRAPAGESGRHANRLGSTADKTAKSLTMIHEERADEHDSSTFDTAPNSLYENKTMCTSERRNRGVSGLPTFKIIKQDDPVNQSVADRYLAYGLHPYYSTDAESRIHGASVSRVSINKHAMSSFLSPDLLPAPSSSSSYGIRVRAASSDVKAEKPSTSSEPKSKPSNELKHVETDPRIIAADYIVEKHQPHRLSSFSHIEMQYIEAANGYSGAFRGARRDTFPETTNSSPVLQYSRRESLAAENKNISGLTETTPMNHPSGYSTPGGHSKSFKYSTYEIAALINGDLTDDLVAGRQWVNARVYGSRGNISEMVWSPETFSLLHNQVTNCSSWDGYDLTVLLKEIMQEARTMTNSERCSVFLLENDATELVAKVFDGHITNTEEVRMPANQGIAGHVVQNGKILNIKNAYSHPLFYKGVDESTGFKTRNILCFPIKDEKDNIIGAAQLCNKIDGDFFTRVDEDVAKALSSYCCISIVHSLMYRDVLDAHNRVRLANELMMFHMHVPREEVQTLVQQKVPSMDEFGTHLKLYELGSSLPRNIPAEKTPLAVISMLEDLGLTQTFKIKSITLARFILMTRKGYRDPPYHNWSHAFSVAHFAFLVIKQLKLVTNKIISELEALAFFIAALCHDIDHRGTTNAFQVASKSVLAALYSSEGSVMERHHFSQTMCILNTEGCNIFENVTRQQYEQLLDMIRDIILSTDIAHHLRLKNAQETIAQTGFDPTNNEHKNLVMCLFMTSSDLSDQTKPWKSTKQVSKMLYKEFFSQGDLEKALGRSPIVMMDRERAQVPGLQVAFIDDIVMPCYGTLAKIFPETKPLVDMVQINREHWSRLKTLAESRRESVNSLDVFDNPEEDEVYLRPPDKQNGNTGPV